MQCFIHRQVGSCVAGTTWRPSDADSDSDKEYRQFTYLFSIIKRSFIIQNMAWSSLVDDRPDDRQVGCWKTSPVLTARVSHEKTLQYRKCGRTGELDLVVAPQPSLSADIDTAAANAPWWYNVILSQVAYTGIWGRRQTEDKTLLPIALDIKTDL